MGRMRQMRGAPSIGRSTGASSHSASGLVETGPQERRLSNCVKCQLADVGSQRQAECVLTMTFKITRNLRMQAVIATLCSFPAFLNRW